MKKASTAILAIYCMNRDKLENELLKKRRTKSVRRSIEAYLHILEQLEKVYEVPEYLINSRKALQ